MKIKQQSGPTLFDLAAQLAEEIGPLPAPEPIHKQPVAPTFPLASRRNYVALPWDGEATRVGAEYANMRALNALAEARKGRELTEYQRGALYDYRGWGAAVEKLVDPSYLKRVELTAADIESARNMSPFSFYTPRWLTDIMWDMALHMGVLGGRVLEPALGNGAFFASMPTSFLTNQSQLFATEKELLASEIAKILYPDATIYAQGLETTKFPFPFDFSIGNVPFGAIPVFDPSFPQCVTESIHNYMIGRVAEELKIGGLGMLLTSRFTLDSKGTEFRQWLSRRIHLIRAIRLPAFAFKPDTEIITDLLIFVRTAEADADGPTAEWIETVDIQGWNSTKRAYTSFTVNEIFNGNYERGFISGGCIRDSKTKVGRIAASHLAYTTNRFGELSPDYRMSETTTPAQVRIARKVLDAITKELPASIAAAPAVLEISDTVAVEKILPGTLRVIGGVVERYGDAGWQRVRRNVNDARSTAAMLALHPLIENVLAANRNTDEEELTDQQKQLREAYAAFVAAHGYLNAKKNKSLLSGDARAPLIRSIEDFDSATEKGHANAIVSERILHVASETSNVETPEEAMLVSLHRTGGIDLELIAELCDKSAAACARALDGKIYEVPGEGWQIAEVALSGNVREKLKTARAAQDARYDILIAELEKVLPADLEPEDITVGLGANWVPARIINHFAAELCHPWGTPNGGAGSTEDNSYSYSAPKFEYLESTGEWIVERRGSAAMSGDYATKLWGTPNTPLQSLLLLLLNRRQLAVYGETRTGQRFLDEQETIALKEKADAIKRAWSEWIWSDKERTKFLVREYNERFNNFVEPTAIALPLPLNELGLRRDAPPLRPYQVRAIWRLLRGQNLLLWHGVGAGKTTVMVVASMLLRRSGIRKRPVHVVPNHLIEQYAQEFWRLFPTAKLMLLSSENVTAKSRSEWLIRVASSDADAIIMTEGVFERIPISPRTWDLFVQSRIDQIDEVMDMADHTDRRSMKRLAAAKERLQTKLAERRFAMTQSGALYWEELGVDMLFYDEAHSLKNLGFQSNMKVAGVGGTESGRALDAFVKTQWLTRRCAVCEEPLNEDTECHGSVRAEGQICFATGTAVTNTLAETYTMQRFLQYDILLQQSLRLFDAWAAQFGKEVDYLEMKPSGTGWRVNTRFAAFFNVPDLIAALRQSADIELDLAAAGVKLPTLLGGAAESIEIETSPELTKIMEECADRADALSQAPKNGDNILAIMGTALDAALDIRLVDRSLPDLPTSKLSVAAKHIADIWHETRAVSLPGMRKQHGLTQAVFMDRGTPGTDGINLYASLKEKLIALGVEPNEIAFIHDAKNDAARAAMFRDVSAGRIRILIGSTKKMGTGANMQRLLYAMHHLDAPWTPADVEQREGRIIRFGNLNEAVRILRYTVGNSLDFYKWHLLGIKARFIAQLMGNANQRKVEDMEQQALSFDELKAIATGDPLLMEQIHLELELRSVALRRQSHNTQISRLHNERDGLPQQIAGHERSAKLWQSIHKMLEENEPQVLIDGTPGQKDKALKPDDNELRLAYALCRPAAWEKPLVQWGDAYVVLRKDAFDHDMLAVYLPPQPGETKPWHVDSFPYAKTPEIALRNLYDVRTSVKNAMNDRFFRMKAAQERIPQVEDLIDRIGAFPDEKRYREIMDRLHEIESILYDRAKQTREKGN